MVLTVKLLLKLALKLLKKLLPLVLPKSFSIVVVTNIMAASKLLRRPLEKEA